MGMSIFEIVFTTHLEDFESDKDIEKLAELLQNERVPYDEITEYVYNSNKENSTEDNEIFNSNKRLFKEASKNSPHYSKIKNNIEKIDQHYKLARIQKQYINRITKEVEKKANETKQLLDDTTESADNLSESVQSISEIVKDIEKKISTIEDTKSSIYTDIIAILGVFSAFVFLMFGGIDTLRTALDATDFIDKASFPKIITLGCIVLLAVLIMLYSLLLWIARFTNKEFGKCMSKKCTNGCQHKFRHAPLRHSFFLGLFSLLITIITIVSVFF